MSRQPEDKNQGVSAFSVFRFPEDGKTSGKPSVQKASWASLAAKRESLEQRSLTSRSYVKTSFIDPVMKSVKAKPVKVVESEEDSPTKPVEPFVEAEGETETKSEAVVSVEQEDAVDSAAIQKILDEMFQKGLEQGRQEGRAEQLDSVKEQARQSGLSEGLQQGVAQGVQQGLAKADQELQSRFATLQHVAAELEGQKKILDERQTGLAARLLEKLLLDILRVELRHSPQRIEAVVRESLALLDVGEQEALRVYLHPDDMRWVAGLVDAEHLSVRLVEDSRLIQGGCRVEGVLGDVDATLETRLAAGVEQLRALLDDGEDDDRDDERGDVATVVDEFAVSARSPRSNAVVDRPVSRRKEPVVEVSSPVSAVPSFSFDPDSSSELGAWDSLGQ